ncbi:hypothetical protein QQZ08_003377 [Neonectria magnoliae]|uniref:Store-operated calcium entry-associated regulatory factor n=1 Tax=Neonectria magnoliae TaxID=2732573 RepID=A0ABR1I8S1_9HYPO
MIPAILALSLTLPGLALAARPPKDAILLSDVESLTLRGAGAKTAHRRVSAIPQLRCISSRPICDLYQIDVLRCTNQGSSYGDEDIEWSCAASLPEELKLGSTDVICEGYNSPDDRYILKGSCGVEYRLALTSKGERRYPNLAHGGGWFDDGQGGTDWGAWVFAAIFVAVLGWIIYSACITAQDNRPPRSPRPHRGGGGWGPGWGPGNDPPPPYPGTKPSQQDNWTPGFWSGMAGGAAAGYLAGNRGRSHNDGNHHGYDGYGSFGRDGSPSSSGSSTSNRYESTGFGSTSRR